MPRPSLCLNIPKTGSSFTSRFFDAADWLELRRRCGLGRLASPNRASVEIVRRIKRYGPGWGNLTCRFWDHHAGYSSLPSELRRHPKLCALRDLRSWYCSFYIYYPTAMTDNLLSCAIRLLVGGDPTAVRDRGTGAILSRHRRAFLERFRRGGRRSGLDREPVDGVRGLVHRDGSPRGHDEHMGGHGRHACRADGVSDPSAR